VNVLKTFEKPALIAFLVMFRLGANGPVFGQDEGDQVAHYKRVYPNDLGVVLNHTQTVSITPDSKTGELTIYETNYEEVLYLQSSARFYTEQSVSLSEFFEDLVYINAYVVKPDGKKIALKPEDFQVVDSPPSSWVFHDDDKEIVFDVIELGEGYKTVIEYKKRVKRPEFFDVFHFVSGYPVEYAKVEISYPDGQVDLGVFERSFKQQEVIRKDELGKKNMRVKSWELNKIPAYRSERGSTNINNHIPHVVVQIRSYQVNGETKKLISTVDELHTFYEEFLLLKEDESDRKELNNVVRSLIEGKTTELEKMDTIYKWVQSNIKYIAFEDGINGYVPRSCSSVMKNRYGDCKDMSNLLVEMLDYAGVKNAYVAWVGTIDIPYQMSEIPSPLTCNHVICVVEKADGEYYYLDATGSEMGYLLPPSAVQEKELLIHKGTGQFELFKVPAVVADSNYLRVVMRYSFVDGDSIRGTGYDCFGGYERQNWTYDLKNLDNEDLYDYLKDLTLRSKNRYTLKEYTIHNLEKNNEELRIDYAFSVDNLLIPHEGRYFFNPVLFKPRLGQFNHADYKYDQEKEHHRTVDYTFEFMVPQNYRVVAMPENVQYRHDLFTFDANYTLADNIVTVSLVYQYRLLSIPPDLFEDWNTFSDHINRASVQNVILEKLP
jgi:transglutaminase-like putative cysteine protease